MSNTQEMLPRSEFTWQVNELVAGIRTEMAGDLQRIVDSDDGIAVSELDLAVQTMLNACYYPAEAVWQGDRAAIKEVANFIRQGDAGRGNALFGAARAAGSVALNRDLITGIALAQNCRLKDLYARPYGDIVLPTYNDMSKSPFGGGAAATSKGRSFVEEDGERRSYIREKLSGTQIVLKDVKREVSQAFATGLHYIHEPREDEQAAFGAYLQGEELPFAWVAYSPIAQQYKREMMERLGSNPNHILEMTRAWNAPWSPKNTMSLLFAHAHSELQRQWQDHKIGEGGRLQGILTSINPNVGFRANAFNGVDFGMVGLKPASYKYLLNKAGKPTYMLRRAIAKELGVGIEDLPGHPRFARNAMPLLPTNEMAVLFDGKARHKPSGPIYVIGASKYGASQGR